MIETNKVASQLRESKETPYWNYAPAENSNPGPVAMLAYLVQGFSEITLRDMEAVALQNRIDTKYIMPRTDILQCLGELQNDYRILSVCGQRLNHYRTLYFDTPSFDLFSMHVNGQAERFKVRSREYLDSQTSFLEVKRKTRKNRTMKERIETGEQMVWMTPEAESWLEDVYPFESRFLEPKLWNSFTRMTLVNNNDCERVTIDFDLSFSTGDRKVNFGEIVVAEVKIDGRNIDSPFAVMMRQHHIHPQGFSKYCIGTSLLYKQVKKNRLKPQLLRIEKINNGVFHG